MGSCVIANCSKFCKTKSEKIGDKEESIGVPKTCL